MSRILLIDDEDVVRGLMVEILESAGHDVTAAETAESALLLLDEDDTLRARRQRRDDAGPLRARAARDGARTPSIAARRARHGRGNVRDAQPSTHARCGRTRDEAVHPCGTEVGSRTRRRACVAEPRRIARASAGADARKRACERDRGTRFVFARSLRTARCACREARRAARPDQPKRSKRYASAASFMTSGRSASPIACC